MDSFPVEKSLFSYLLFLLLACSFSFDGASSSSTQEAAALLQWKASFLNQNINPRFTSWNVQSLSVPCTWFGVSCINGSINGLNITGSNVHGTLQNFPFSHLPNLEFLDMSMNKLGGELLPQMGNLTKLSLLHLDSNQFSGSIPKELGNLNLLTDLSLGYNELTGPIPNSLGNLTKLTGLYLQNNTLSGTIPEDLGKLKNLKILMLVSNELTGYIPTSLGNLTHLTSLDLSNNQLFGSIPMELGDLSMVKSFRLSQNRLTGSIPHSLTNLSNVEDLFLMDNQLTGSIPDDIGKPQSLLRFFFSFNQLSGELPKNLCQNGRLLRICVQENKLTSISPSSFKNCSSLLRANLHDNHITGNITELFDDVYPNLNYIDLSNNKLYGELSSNWGNCKNVTGLQMANNNITGLLPPELGDLVKLEMLNFSFNQLVGEIPKELGKLSSMLTLHLQGNMFSGNIPREIGFFTKLLSLDLSSNFLRGSIPDNLGHCQQLYYLNLSSNSFSQNIPIEMGKLTQLSQLDLSSNFLSGVIPWEFGNLRSIEILDLSHNNLSGVIPKGLADLSGLQHIDISFNNLEGSLPNGTGTAFVNVSIEQLKGNKDLCGYNVSGLPSCKQYPPHSTIGKDIGTRKAHRTLVVIIVVVSLLGSLFLLCPLVVGVLIFQGRFRRINQSKVSSDVTTPNEKNGNLFSICTFDGKEMYKRIIEATEEFSESFCIGEGGYGKVYKAELSPDNIVAVKKLHSSSVNQNGFLNEIRALTMIKHRNILKLLGFCSTAHHSFLMYEYLEGGSLARILSITEEAKRLDWLKRVNIIKGISRALAYMHHDCSPPIVHRDISSNNILLDSEYEARVSDFGTAKLLKMDSSNHSAVAGTYGYIAPGNYYNSSGIEFVQIVLQFL